MNSSLQTYASILTILMQFMQLLKKIILTILTIEQISRFICISSKILSKYSRSMSAWKQGQNNQKQLKKQYLIVWIKNMQLGSFQLYFFPTEYIILSNIMGSLNCSTVPQQFFIKQKDNTYPSEYENDQQTQYEHQIRSENQQAPQTKNFLFLNFRQQKEASKRIEFSINQNKSQQTKNAGGHNDFTLAPSGKFQKQINIQNQDYIKQENDSEIFGKAETPEILQHCLLEQSNGAQQESMNSPKGRIRSSLKRYSNNYKVMKIKQSSFVKIQNKKFQFYYELLQKIGQGAFGNVFKARSLKTKQIKAVKILKNGMLKQIDQKLLMQLDILRNLDHPNIIKVYDVFCTQELCYVVTEYCPGGTLEDYMIKQPGNIDKGLIKIIMKQLLGAMSYLHSQSVIHRDIKLQNIVFDVNPKLCSSFQDIQIKVLDFGLAMKAKYRTINKQRPYIGTPRYMAPQVLIGRYSQKCDIWSCGVILYVLLTRQILFKAHSIQEMFQKIKNQELDFSKPNLKFLQEQVKQLMRNMLQKDPQKRINAEQTLNSKWLQQVFQQSKSTEKELIIKKLQQYKKQNNFITLIESYLVFLKTNQKERKSMIALFQKIDANNNGVIDLRQLQMILPQTGYLHTEKLCLSQLLNKMGKNTSGKIELSEFLTAFSDRSQLFTQQYLAEAFDFIDENKNGYIDKKQLKEALNGCQKEEYDELWKDIDKDLDSQISKKQFIEYLLQIEQSKMP